MKEWIQLFLAIGPAIMELVKRWQDRSDEKALERISRRRARRRMVKQRTKEKLDAVDNDDPAGLVRAANRVRDEETDDNVTGD